MSVTRDVFDGLTRWEILLWYALSGISTTIFLWGVVLLVLKYRRGRPRQQGLERPGRRLLQTAKVVFAHAQIRRRDPAAGLAHLLVFYGFLALFVGTVILAFQDLAGPAFGFEFFHGWFYRVYSLTLDVLGLGLPIGLAVFAWKRGVQRPFRLDYRRPDRAAGEYDRRRYVVGDWAFLGVLFFLALTGFLLEAFRIAQYDPAFERWSPVGWAGGQTLRALGLAGGAAGDARLVTWWVHGVFALAFVSSIPFTKALHMLTAPANVAVRGDGGRTLGPPPDDAAEIGYGRIGDLQPRHLLALDACTKCGKCHVACPATNSGLPLSPRDLVLDLREVAEGAYGLRSTLRLPPLHEGDARVLGDPIRAETLWSCMQCMACVEICPVGIEHVPVIVELRRRLVEEGDLDELLQSTLEAVYETGNSFGEPRRKRARWTRELPFEVKDARKEPVELLWFVGDYASFDPRNQRATRALARALHAAGVDFGILFDAERTGGCDVRRVGEEGLFAELAAANVETVSACDFGRIVTSDPHTFHTLRNEYPQFGGTWEVVHHSQLLLELLEIGRLTPTRPLRARATYHDPCKLGRYNGVYDPPREVLRRIGLELVEMPRNRDNSFCCGAGGGRIWMKGPAPAAGARRPSEQRIDEATALPGVELFVVACPKDVMMYEDAIKTSGHAGEIELRELSELVLESLGLDAGEASAVAAGAVL